MITGAGDLWSIVNPVEISAWLELRASREVILVEKSGKSHCAHPDRLVELEYAYRPGSILRKGDIAIQFSKKLQRTLCKGGGR